MSNIIPCKFRFDSCLEYEIPRNLLDFYLDLSKRLFGGNFSFPEKTNLITISVEEGDVDFNPSIPSKLLSEKLTSDYKKFKTSAANNTFLIDLSRSSKGSKILYPLINEQLIPVLKTLCKDKNRKFNQPVFLILLETLNFAEKQFITTDSDGIESSEFRYEPDSYYTLLEKYILNGSVGIVGFNDNQGIFSWKNDQFKKISNFYSMTRKLKDNALELMEYKLIKKIGHFRRDFNGKHSSCQQFYYDGKYCENEIFELITESILQSFNGKKSFNPTFIVFHCPTSQWVKNSILRTKGELLKLKTKEKFSKLNFIGCFDINDMKSSLIHKEKCEILFVADFIHSGATFKNVYMSKVMKHFPNATTRGLTVLCTNSALKTNKAKRPAKTFNLHIPDQNAQIPVKYIKSVEHKVYERADKKDPCPMCKYELLAWAESSDNDNSGLSSYEMWLIAKLAGYSDELVKSGEERALHFLPDTMNIIEQNGPYLAYKFSQTLKRQFPGFDRKNLVIIFPDETKNIYFIDKMGSDTIDLTETPSGRYAKCLKELLGVEFYGVPREVLHAVKGAGNWKNKQINFDQIPTKFRDVHRQIEKLHNFIIIDEFHSTGRTFEMLLGILEHFGKTPIFYFPILNYGSETMAERTASGINSFPCMAFYELNLN